MKTRVGLASIPLTAGLMNRGGQATGPEASFWELENCTTDADGRIHKRSGLQQWGQTIKEPATGGVGWHEIFRDFSQWSIKQNDDKVPLVFSKYQTIQMSTTETTAGSSFLFLKRLPQPQDGIEDPGEAGLRDFRTTFKARAALPQADMSAPHRGLEIRVSDGNSSMAVFQLWQSGIYYYNGTRTLIPNTKIDTGSWYVLEFRLTSSTSAEVYINDSLITTVTDLVLEAEEEIKTDNATIALITTANGLIDVEFDSAIYRSGNGNIVGVPIRSLYDWHSPNPVHKHIVAITDKIIYQDIDHNRVFLSLAPAPDGNNVVAVPWLGELIFLNSSGVALRWDGNQTPQLVPATMPFGATVGAAHQSRLYVARGLRVYFSGANNIGDWTTEEGGSFTTSGFFDIPDPRGRKITAMLGDHQGQLIIWTEGSTWTWVGDDPININILRQVARSGGCVGPRAFDVVAKDIVHLSDHGIHSVGTTNQHGDFAPTLVSTTIRNLFQRDSQFGLPKILVNSRANVIHIPDKGRTYIGVQTQGTIGPARIFELNHDTNQWSGPWTAECEGLEYVLLGFPPTPMLMAGDLQGRIASFSDDRKFDFESEGYTMKVRSSRIDGRTLNPALTRRTKKWRDLKIHILPRGPWDLTVSWVTDGHKRDNEDNPETFSQNVYRDPLLDSSFILDSSETSDSERIGPVTIPLDRRGRYLEFTIQQRPGEGLLVNDSVDQDLIIAGIEVDFNVNQDDIESS